MEVQNGCHKTNRECNRTCLNLYNSSGQRILQICKVKYLTINRKFFQFQHFWEFGSDSSSIEHQRCFFSVQPSIGRSPLHVILTFTLDVGYSELWIPVLCQINVVQLLKCCVRYICEIRCSYFTILWPKTISVFQFINKFIIWICVCKSVEWFRRNRKTMFVFWYTKNQRIYLLCFVDQFWFQPLSLDENLGQEILIYGINVNNAQNNYSYFDGNL